MAVQRDTGGSDGTGATDGVGGPGGAAVGGAGGTAGGAGGGKAGYHHGDLRNALTDAATGLARDGGPEAVVLRAAARRVGVSPTAAYRHFDGQGDLLHAVRERGQQRLAEFMEEAGVSVTDPAERVRAMGRGYVAFAREEPGLFRTAFSRAPHAPHTAQPSPLTEEGAAIRRRSFVLLLDGLDAMVEAGQIAPERRPGAEFAAWSTVHGLATLILDGPLSGLPGDQLDVVIDRALSVTLDGLVAPRHATGRTEGDPRP